VGCCRHIHIRDIVFRGKTVVNVFPVWHAPFSSAHGGHWRPVARVRLTPIPGAAARTGPHESCGSSITRPPRDMVATHLLEAGTDIEPPGVAGHLADGGMALR